jgi:adenine-specific DNA-methyltransferase
MIKYLGSKRTLLPLVLRAVESVPRARSVLDLFSGTSRVGHALKRAGYRVLANDHNAYAAILARCYVAADRDRVEADARKLLAEFTALPGDPGWFTETYCEQARFFKPKNGARVDAIREAIATKHLDPELEAVVLVSLMEAADRVDSTCGLQMAYLKQWASRADRELELRLPDILPRAARGKSEAHQLEAIEAARVLRSDVAYLDPPYNQHSYLSNYHVWESLVLWDKPEVYGTARKRIDCRARKSPLNSKRQFHTVLAEIIEAVNAKVLLVSFNNEGYIGRTEMEALLSTRGRVTVLVQDYKRYVGAQIGIYNPSGERVGAVSHLRNLEYLYVVETDSLGERLDLDGLIGDNGAEQQLGLFADAADRGRGEDRGQRGGTARKPAAAVMAKVEDDLDLVGLGKLLAAHRSLSSAQAQALTKLSAAELRPMFKGLLASGRAYTTGKRRGTVYHAVVETRP